MVERVERHLVRRGDANYKVFAKLCSMCRKLGNETAYYLRHLIFFGIPLGSMEDTDKKIREIYPDLYRALPSAMAQRQVQIVHQQFTTFYASLAAYKEDPSKFTGKPNLPGYAKKYRTLFVNRNGYKIENGKLFLAKGQKLGIQPTKVLCCQNQPFNAKCGAVCGDLRIVPMGHSFMLELTYEVEDQVEDPKAAVALDKDHALVIDLGIRNLVTAISTRPGVPPLLVKGGVVKSINQWYNKRVANLLDTGHDSVIALLQAGDNRKAKFRRSAIYEHLAEIARKRNFQIYDLMHKVSHLVIEYCLANDLGTIVIGLNRDWKQRCTLGRVGNQRFVQIPHARLVTQITYKAQAVGINVIVREESYTSKASNLDFDPIPASYKKDAKYQFSGKRFRGLYRTKDGRFINSDINGALGIARKELGDEWLRTLLVNGGFVDKPVVIRNLHQKADCGALLKAVATLRNR